MTDRDRGGPERHQATRLTRAGRDKALTGPFVNPPVVHASTVLFPSVEEMMTPRQRYRYGRRGTPTTEALEAAVSELEGAEGTGLFPSGLSAIATALLACLAAGDHVLMVDCAYFPARDFAGKMLQRLGVTTTFFDPAIGSGLADLFTERTRAVYLESPGSHTFEMQDIPAIAAVARERGAVVIADNTWATGYFCRPLTLGADISVQAGTKYLGGHSDVMLGTASANAAWWPKLRETQHVFGLTAGPDDIYLALRGIRTLGVRLDRQMASAMRVATWLADRVEVGRVHYPALPDDPGHRLWQRDMSGASGLFSFDLAAWGESEAMRLIDGLELFGIGASWGGFESLAVLASHRLVRTATSWPAGRPLIRLHIGLEDPDDLIADLDQAFAKVSA